jgi:hypothetical protein
MLESVPTVVINSGVDWGAVATGISAGVAALAGIGGTIWVATRNWNREDERAKIAEKRRMYAACLGALANGSRARQSVETSDNPDRREAFALAANTAANAVWELELIAPKAVGRLATDVLVAMYKPAGFGKVQGELILAMRADLGGEPLADEEPAGDPVGSSQQPDNEPVGPRPAAEPPSVGTQTASDNRGAPQ